MKTIERQSIKAFAAELGLQPNEVKAILIESGRITVTAYELDSDGHKFRGPDGEVATKLLRFSVGD